MKRRFVVLATLVSGLLIALALVPLIVSAQTATPGATGTAAAGTGTAGAGSATTGTGTAATGTGTAAATTAATATQAATTAATATTAAATGVGGAVATTAPQTTLPATGHPSDRGSLNYALVAVMLLALGAIGVGLGVHRRATRS